jgi:hypothetical protein
MRLIDTWRDRHDDAMTAPRNFEVPIVHLYRALISYAAQHERRYESRIGEDFVLGPAWLAIARNLLRLLDGETGRLDCGTLDGDLRRLAVSVGFTEAEFDDA